MFPNTKFMTKKNILEGLNYIQIEFPIKNEEDIKSEKDLKRIKQSSDIWLELRKDGENSLIERLKKDVFLYKNKTKVIRASTILNHLALFSPYCSNYFDSTMLGNNDEFKALLQNKKLEFSKFSQVSMEYGKEHENNVLCAFIDHFKESNPILHETGYHILRNKNNDLEIWCSPDAMFEFIQDGKVILKGSFEAKTLTPFIPDKKNPDNFIFISNRKPSDKITYYYILQYIVEIYSTNSDYGFLASYSLFRGTNFFLTKKTIHTDKIIDLMFKCLEWKEKHYANYQGEELSDNPFEECRYYEELLQSINYLSKNALQIFTQSESEQLIFNKNIGFEKQLFFNLK